MADIFSIEECERLNIEEVRNLYQRYVNRGYVDLFSSFSFGRDLVEKAEGSIIYTRSGRQILDFTAGFGVLIHGHNHPRILKARMKYAEMLRMEVHRAFFSPYIAGLSHNIAQLMPGDLKVCYFPNSGAEAVEGAMKMAYKYHQGLRQSILYSDISFHGKLLGAGSVTGSSATEFNFPKIPGTTVFEYNAINSVKDAVEKLRCSDGTSDVYALILEPFSASTLRNCSAEFLMEVRKICLEEDIILIFDEVYTGWGSTGQLFYFMYTDVIPDILTTSKALGGGKASISGYVASERVFKRAYGNINDAMLHSTTYYGFGEECITAIEAINTIVEDDFPAKARQVESVLHPALCNLKNKYPNMIEEVRGKGALQGIQFKVNSILLTALTKLIPPNFFRDDKFLQILVTASVIEHLYSQHSILTRLDVNGDVSLMISPVLVVTPVELHTFIDSLDQTLSLGFMHLCFNLIKSKYFGGH